MKKLVIAIALVLLSTPAFAGPITFGSWSPTPTPDLELNKSEDDCSNGPHMCAAVWFLPAGTEQLNAGFGYEAWPGAELWVSLTDYTDAPRLSYDGAAFHYDNGHGFISSSWDHDHFHLWRLGNTYYMGVEDLPHPIVPDWNDAIYRWEEVEKKDVDIAPVPEPATLVLFGTGLLSLVRRRR